MLFIYKVTAVKISAFGLQCSFVEQDQKRVLKFITLLNAKNKMLNARVLVIKSTFFRSLKEEIQSSVVAIRSVSKHSDL